MKVADNDETKPRGGNYLDDRVVINISGEKFETREETLSRYPETLLGCPRKRHKYFDPRCQEYFFNRNRLAFDAILFYYQSYGRLIKPEVLPENIFVDEVVFFQIKCPLVASRENTERRINGHDTLLPQNPIQRRIWLLFSVPESSFSAKVVALLSVIVILLSVVIPCLETLEEDSEFSPNTPQNFKISNSPYPRVEMACYVWFTIELIVRFASAPKKILFLLAPMNIIDILTVLPYYIVLVLEVSISGSLAVLRIARMTRILRIFKLSRYSSGMRILMYSLYTSMRELGMFMIFISVCILVSSSAAFYAEYGDERSSFTSIPDAFWWSVNTITTVGYGDQYPITWSGKLVGIILTVVGVLVICLPVFLFVANFTKLLTANMLAAKETENPRIKELESQASASSVQY